MTYTPQDFSDFSMLDIFRMEVETQVTILNDNLLAVEVQGHSNFAGVAPKLEALMRAAHSIKGAARIVGLDLAVKVAHVMEDCFVAAQTGQVCLDSQNIDILLRGIDWYDQLRQVEDACLSSWFEQQADATNQLVNDIAELLHSPSPQAFTTATVEVVAAALSTQDSPPQDLPPQDSPASNSPTQASNNPAHAPSIHPQISPVPASDPPIHAPVLSGQAPLSQVSNGKAHVPDSLDQASSAQASNRTTHKNSDTADVYQGSDPTLTTDNDINIGNNFINTNHSNGNGNGNGRNGKQNGNLGSVSPQDISPVTDSVAVASSVESAPKNTSKNSSHQQLSYLETSGRVVRVSVDNLNRLMALAGESLVEVNWFQPFADTMLHLKRQQQDLARSLANLLNDSNLPPSHYHRLVDAQKTAQDCHALLSDRLDDLDQFSRRFSQLSDNLYREVIASHMCPFADGVQSFPRMVRDLAKTAGKRISLDIIGQRTPVDRDILEKLEAPLTHMLRNAIAHGIEDPDQRRQLGKPEVGTIRLEACHRAGMLCISVSDDGRGLDVEDLRQKVVQKQLTTASMAAKMNETELIDFLFLPGFSTAKQVTEIAGRGVGLDIAHSMVQEVGGLLRASSIPGQGLTFDFQLPLTLSVIRALLVEISGEPYAFGLNRIDRVLMVNRETIAVNENHPYIMVDDEAISLANASQVLELPDSPMESFDLLSVVLLSNQTHRYGLIVDRFLGEQDLVIRPLDPRLQKVQNISAAALSDQGAPLLVIDVADLVCSIEKLFAGGQLSVTHSTTVNAPVQPKRILVVDDSITVREMERKLLQNSGYQVDIAVNGMEGWNTIRSGQYDLIISDIDMPRMNGIELVQQIKDHPHLNKLPVIIVSYKDRQDDQLAGLRAGADYYLTKSSFHDNSLLTAVADLIGS
ncbi:MAG: hybrid sensor histidine kinase/response regulator [Cyanobacteria bacterium P01_F01_bin.150]